MAYHGRPGGRARPEGAVDQPNGQDERPSSVRDALEDQIRHIERQATFALEMANALKQEFQALWAMPGARAQLDGGDAFVAQVDATAALAERFMADGRKARGLPPLQGQRLVRLLDVNKLLARGRGLEATARALRTHPRLAALSKARPAQVQPARPPQPARTGPLHPPARKLTEHLQDVLDRLTITPVAPQAVAPPPSLAERRLLAFEAALSLVADVLADTGPRLEALRWALSAVQPDPPDEATLAARTASVPADLRALIPAAGEALRHGPLARRAAAIALDQWNQAARLAEGYTRARGHARASTPEHVSAVLAPYDVIKLKGLIVPLTNLHLTFRTIPALAALFPPPIKRRLELAVPTSDQRKPADEAAPTPAGAEGEPDQAAAEAPERLGAEEISGRRMALIMQWMEDPAANPALQDVTVIYRIVAEEREYQQDRVMDLGMRLRLLPPMMDGEPPAQAAQRAKLMRELETARTRQVQLQELLGYVAARQRGA